MRMLFPIMPLASFARNKKGRVRNSLHGPEKKKGRGSFHLPTALSDYPYRLMISQKQRVDPGVKIPVKIKPAAKVKMTKLIHDNPL
jgi:hypothetical protein